MTHELYAGSLQLLLEPEPALGAGDDELSKDEPLELWFLNKSTLVAARPNSDAPLGAWDHPGNGISGFFNGAGRGAATMAIGGAGSVNVSARGGRTLPVVPVGRAKVLGTKESVGRCLHVLWWERDLVSVTAQFAGWSGGHMVVDVHVWLNNAYFTHVPGLSASTEVAPATSSASASDTVAKHSVALLRLLAAHAPQPPASGDEELGPGEGADDSGRGAQAAERPANLRDEVLAIIRPDGWTEVAPQPSGLKRQLYRYQRRALAWMLWREQHHGLSGGAERGSRGAAAHLRAEDAHPLWRRTLLPSGATVFVNIRTGSVSRVPIKVAHSLPGGCLCDEMGLGKTAEVIALVLAHPPPPAGKDEPEEPGEGGLAPEGHVKRSPKEDGAATSPKPEPGPSGRQWGPTLVVAPANLLQQWKSEIAHFSDLRVLLYEGLDDVPLPSEDGAGPSEPGGSGGAGGAGGGGKKRSKKRGRATQDDIEHQARLLARDLGVTAPSHVQLLLRSMEELGVPMPDWDPRLREAKAAEAERQCREADVVLTSYAVLQAEIDFKPSERSLRQPKRYPVPITPLLAVPWWRLVLDEAQEVASGISKVAQMALRIQAAHRWCVTGTPIGRGGLSDIQGQLQVLHHEPFADAQLWKELVQAPYERRVPGSESRLVSVLRPIMWRNTKQSAAEDVPLPGRSLRLAELHLTQQEKIFYDVILDRARRKAEARRKAGQEAAEMQTVAGALESGGGTGQERRAVSAQVMRLRRAADVLASETRAMLTQLRCAAIHPQLTQFWASMGAELQIQGGGLSMVEIMATLQENIQSELQAKERDLCVSLNAMARKLVQRAAAAERARAAEARAAKSPGKGSAAGKASAKKNAKGGAHGSAHGAGREGGAGDGDGVGGEGGGHGGHADGEESGGEDGAWAEGDEEGEGGEEGAGRTPRKLRKWDPELLTVNPEEDRRRALDCLTKSWRVGENGIDALLGGEDAGDENIKLKASSWAAWVQIQVNTETARADLLEMMGEDPEGVREHRSNVERKVREFLETEEAALGEAQSKHAQLIEKIHETGAAAARHAGAAEEAAFGGAAWARAGWPGGRDVGGWLAALAGVVADAKAAEGRAREEREERARDRAMQGLLGREVFDALDAKEAELKDARTGLEGAFLMERVEAAAGAVGRCREALASSSAPSNVSAYLDFDKPPHLAAAHRALYLGDSGGAVRAAAAVASWGYGAEAAVAGEFLHRKVYNPLVKLSRSVSRGAREGLEGARGEGLLRAVCAVRRVADAVGLWRQEHKADMQVALKRHDMDSAAQTMTAAKDKHPAVRKQLRASLEDIEEAAVESEKLCRTLRGRFKFVRSSAGGAPEERPREARTGVAERDGKAGGGAESSGAAGVGSEGGARVQEEATGGVGGDRGGDGAGAGSLNGVGGSGEATVSGGAKRGREEGVEGGEGVGVGEGGGRKRVRFATETKGGEGAGSAEGGTEPGAAGGGVEGRGGGVGGAGGLAGTSMQPLGGGGESTCAVCLDSLEVEGAAIHVYPCGHRFHAACGERLWDDPVQRGKCPHCRVKCKPSDIFRAVHSTRASGTSSNHGDPCSDFPDMADTLPGITGDFGTKVSALVRRLKWLERNFPEQKSLVFSSFAPALEFVSKALHTNDIAHSKLLRSGGRKGNAGELRKFYEQPDVRVMLLALKAGAAGLTLVQASNVFLLEPTIDPAVEQQAVARVHRIGQTRPVVCTRLLVRQTVEEAVLKINESRQSLFATHGDAGHGEAEPDDEATTLAELAPDQDTLDEADVDALLGM